MGLSHTTYRILAELMGVDGSMIQRQEYQVDDNVINTYVGQIKWNVEEVPENVFCMRLTLLDVHHQLLTKNEYLFTVNAVSPLDPLRRLPSADVHVGRGTQPNQIVVSNKSSVAAVGVFLIQENPQELIHLDHNYVTVFPGENVVITSPNLPITPDDFYLEGMNLSI